ncbi:hypothetical protein [Clostridium sp. C2-6-12]|uniref:hypothetical protein n=1 Tax=Clostridium sp. C2-6-12 TaxID=2698832 RepID=UPI00136C2F4B|nr:hypothetical protein [Clostridium sp. C2-6-12]
MFSKKLLAVFVAAGVVASTSTIFNEINIKGAFADTIKQNVVYSKDNAASVSQNNIKLSDADNKEIKEKSSEALKNYLSVSTDTDKDFEYSSELMNETTLIDEEAREQKRLQEEYDKKEISTEEYNQEKAYIPQIVNGLKNHIAKLKHGVITAKWSHKNGNMYTVEFNENTKEIECVQKALNMDDTSRPEAKLAFSEQQLKNTAENFIKEHKLGDLQKPNFILLEDNEEFYQVFYQEENDPSKKVGVYIDSHTGQVTEFLTKSTANLIYDNMINLKK